MENYRIVLASVPDREKAVAEIWYKDQMIAEINDDQGQLEIEFYLKDRITLDMKLFLDVLEQARKKLN